MPTAILESSRKQPDDFRYPPQQGEWTYDDYVAFIPENETGYEIINGRLTMLSAPMPKHQTVVLNISFEMKLLLRSGDLQGKVYVAPIDVRMEPFASPVQPDVVFIRQDNVDIITEKNITGVPNLLVEVLSTNFDHDRRVKFEAYRKAGVGEYWIVDPEAETVEVFVLRDALYVRLARFQGSDIVRSEVMPIFAVSAETFFQ